MLLYLLGRFASARHRVLIFSSGLLLFALGGAFNAVLYSATGAIVFMLCLVMGRPLMDLGYFPIQLRVIDYVSRKENATPTPIFSSTNSPFTSAVSSGAGCSSS